MNATNPLSYSLMKRHCRWTTSWLAYLLMIIMIMMMTHHHNHCMAMPNDGLATVPPMGWSTLYAHYLDVSEGVVRDAADQLVQSGLRDLGYQYVNIDDCWMGRQRDAITHQLVPNSTTFPSGMSALAKYVHDRGLKLGIYSSAGTMTCTKFPASLFYEDLDAQTFADWGIDYLKYDNCYSDGSPDVVRHSRMRNALLQTKRPMLFSLCNGGGHDIWRWAPSVGHLWRSTVDIQRHWTNIYHNYWNNQVHLESMLYHGKYMHSWADPDMLQISGTHEGRPLPLAEQKSQFGLWVMAKAPLILSTNLAQLPQASLDIVSNPRLIQLHQNPNYPPARCVVGCRTNNNTRSNNNTSGDGNWSLPYSILATSNVLNDDNDETRSTTNDDNVVTVAIIINWSDKNQTLTNVTFYAHDVGVVPLPLPPHGSSSSSNTNLIVTDLWTGNVVMIKTLTSNNKWPRCKHQSETNTTTWSTSYEPIPIVIPILEPHDNAIYQFEIKEDTMPSSEQEDCPPPSMEPDMATA